MPIFRFWRKSVPELLHNYQLLREKTENAKDVYKQISITNKKEKFKAFNHWLELFGETHQYMIEVISRFSPENAKTLKSQLKGYLERQKEYATIEHWDKSEISSLPIETKNRIISETLDDSMDKYSELQKKEINMVFIAILDTIKRVKGKLPLYPEEKVRRILQEQYPKLSDKYFGAYHALETDNPDRYRHCSASMRTIIDDLIGDNSTDRKKFIETHSISNRDSEILEALYRLIKSIDDSLNKGVHSDIDYETVVLTIQATEIIIGHLFHLYKE
jgi:hypothetical protein